MLTAYKSCLTSKIMTWTISFLLSIHLLLALGQWGGAGVYITTWIIMICTYWVMCLNIQPSYFHFYSFKGPCPDYFHCYCFNVTCNCNLQLEKTAQWESLLLIRDLCVWHLHTMVVRDWGETVWRSPQCVRCGILVNSITLKLICHFHPNTLWQLIFQL